MKLGQEIFFCQSGSGSGISASQRENSDSFIEDLPYFRGGRRGIAVSSRSGSLSHMKTRYLSYWSVKTGLFLRKRSVSSSTTPNQLA